MKLVNGEEGLPFLIAITGAGLIHIFGFVSFSIWAIKNLPIILMIPTFIGIFMAILGSSFIWETFNNKFIKNR